MRIVLFFIAFIRFSVPAQAQHIAQADSSTLAVRLVNFAESFLGVPYRYAGKTPKAFDCSGFLQYVFGHFGFVMPASSSLYARLGKEIPIAEARPGDVLVFTGTNAAIRSPGHVGIITVANGQNPCFIHASSAPKTYCVTRNYLTDGSYRKRFLKVVRVLP
jgi:cell wall-associated NlpC family hydrolase